MNLPICRTSAAISLSWPAPEGLVLTSRLASERERGRGSRKENENKPYPHPVRTLPSPDQQRQIPAGDASQSSCFFVECSVGVGTGVGTAASQPHHRGTSSFGQSLRVQKRWEMREWERGRGIRTAASLASGQGGCEGDQSSKIRVAGEWERGSGLTVHGQKFKGRLQEGPIQDIRFATCFQVFNMPIDLIL
jgi:hypothetical protein